MINSILKFLGFKENKPKEVETKYEPPKEIPWGKVIEIDGYPKKSIKYIDSTIFDFAFNPNNWGFYHVDNFFPKVSLIVYKKENENERWEYTIMKEPMSLDSYFVLMALDSDNSTIGSEVMYYVISKEHFYSITKGKSLLEYIKSIGTNVRNAKS